jgi:hypothetical protein
MSKLVLSLLGGDVEILAIQVIYSIKVGAMVAISIAL